jgi:hypothetical protein
MLIATVDTDKDGGDAGEILKNGASNQANNLPGSPHFHYIYWPWASMDVRGNVQIQTAAI